MGVVWPSGRSRAYGDGEPYYDHELALLIEEGPQQSLLGSSHRGRRFGCPAQILQGAKDPEVPWRQLALANRCLREDVVLTMIQDGDHRPVAAQDTLRGSSAAVAEIGLDDFPFPLWEKAAGSAGHVRPTL